MNIIGNKMLAYIDNHNELTQSMINEYNSSLIFLGDEKQIFVPIINTYVGIGESAYQYLLNKIGSSDANFDAFNEYIHKDTVTSIYAQFTPTELEEKRQQSSNGSFVLRGENINDQGISYTAFKANRNVVIKGLNPVNELTGNTIDVNTYSGINVSITHASQLQTGEYIYNNERYTYSYYAPYDIITVDDSYTWSYIRNSNTYMTEFVTKFATQQANRVYKNILGESEEYIEKSFNEAFNYDEETGTLNIIKPVYVKTKTGGYSEVTVENTTDGYRIKATVDNAEYIVYSTIAGDTVANLSTILADENNAGLYGGYYHNANLNIDIPYWYNFENTGSTGNTNIADGIQTLKEVAYILDQITDGKGSGYDTGIQLAYNIASNHDEIEKLKAWQSDIGNQTVSTFKSESNTNLLTVNYYSTNLWNKDDEDNQGAIGKVKLDLDLRLATTYELGGATYAAYYANHNVPAGQTTYFIKHDDATNAKNYILVQDVSAAGTTYSDLISLIKSHPDYTGNTQITLVGLVKDDQSKVIGTTDAGSVTTTVDQLTYQATELYLYFPYTKANYKYDQGLTDVKWVTTYVGWTAYNILSQVNANNTNVNEHIDEIIGGLNSTDTDNHESGQFVTYVSQNNGKIDVKKHKLPLDTILKNDVFYTHDIYIHIDSATAKSEKQNNGVGKLYILSNGVYTQIGQSTELGDDILDNIYYKTSLASMVPVPADTTVDTLLTNAGGVSYFYKNTGGTSNYVSYLPLDIQKENTSGTLLASDKVAADNTIYYLNSSASISNIKYFDLSTIHMTNGSTKTIFTSYITYLAAASASNTGLADAWDVRRTIESLFTWVNVKTNKIIL